MGKIFCIMGKSSSGKDTLYQRLLQREDLHLERIVSYTTRPIRAGETDGLEYHFCSCAERDRLLAARSYHTCHGQWDYFTVEDEGLDPEHRDYLIIGTLESYEKIRDHFTSRRVVPIYIEVEDGLRLQRALSREMRQKEPKYEEMCRRFLADAADFSKERLREAGVTKIFYNRRIEETEDEIASFIMEQTGRKKV